MNNDIHVDGNAKIDYNGSTGIGYNNIVAFQIEMNDIDGLQFFDGDAQALVQGGNFCIDFGLYFSLFHQMFDMFEKGFAVDVFHLGGFKGFYGFVFD